MFEIALKGSVTLSSLLRNAAQIQPNTWCRFVDVVRNGPPSSLSATNTTSSSCLPKKSASPASYLQPPTTPNVFWQTVNKLLHRKSSSPLPTSSPGTSLADSFASVFTGKISKLRLPLTSHPATSGIGQLGAADSAPPIRRGQLGDGTIRRRANSTRSIRRGDSSARRL